MKQLYFVLLFFSIQISTYAQYHIQVLDQQTKDSIAGAGVYFPDTKTGTMTDVNGYFTLDSKVSSVLVQVSFMGYKTFLGVIRPSTDSVIFLSSDSHNLQEITVSASTSKLQGENVLNVENVKLNDNPLLQQGSSLAQKLSGIAGVDNFSTGGGIGKPVIRGLSGNRVAVFSQGVRVENQQWGDEHGLGLDENGFEQVEVIKGPASLLYGSDALGGVFYFVGERYANDNSIEATLNSEYSSNTDGWRNTGLFKLSKGKFHWNLSGGYTTDKDYKDGNDNIVGNSRFHTTDFKTAWGYTGSKFTTALRYNYLYENYGLSEVADVDSIPHYVNNRTPEMPHQDLTTHMLSSENAIFFSDESNLKIDLGYIFNNRREFEGDSSQPSEDNGVGMNMDLNTLSLNVKWNSPEIRKGWSLVVGTQEMYQNNKNKGTDILIPDATTTDFGLYAMSDYYYTAAFHWQIGARLDGRNIDGQETRRPEEDDALPSFSHFYKAFNFSTGIQQQLPNDFSLRVSVSSGYRAPSMFELLSDGVHEGTNRYEIGNNDLKTENSYQADLSLEYKTEHLNVFVNPYFNYIRDYIFLQPSDEIKENLPVDYYAQSDAYLAGGEAGIHLHPHPLDWLHIQASYECTYGQDTEGSHLPLMPAPKINTIVNANFSGSKLVRKFSVFGQYQYVFEQTRVAQFETKTPDYSLFNAGLNTELRVDKYALLLDVTVNNLLNEHYYDHLSRYKTEGIYNIGRNLVIKLSIPFEATL